MLAESTTGIANIIATGLAARGGWVSEQHPHLPWPHDGCPGPGMLFGAEHDAHLADRDRGGFVEESLEDFIAHRDDWLDVQVIPNEHDTWSVALRLDGFYSDRQDAEVAAESFRQTIEQALAKYTGEWAPVRMRDWRRVDQWWKD